MDEPAIERAFAAAQFGTYQWRLLIIAGVGWMTDGMEMYVMALILPLLASEMELSADALGMMGGGVFMGMGAGAYFWGAVADHYGRRPAYGGALLTSLVFGFTTAASPGVGGLMASRILVGGGVGGFLPVSTTMLVESGPATAHASNIVAMCCLFTLGACFEALLGWLILPTLGWRWLVAISALVRCPPFPRRLSSSRLPRAPSRSHSAPALRAAAAPRLLRLLPAARDAGVARVARPLRGGAAAGRADPRDQRRRRERARRRRRGGGGRRREDGAKGWARRRKRRRRRRARRRTPRAGAARASARRAASSSCARCTRG